MKTPTQWEQRIPRNLLLICSTAVALSICCGTAVAGDDHNRDGDHQRSTAEDFLSLQVKPIAIGHHGVGPNTGENPALPIENTVDSVQQAYRLGARVVEVDVQLTADGKLAVFHDDFLSDFTCIHSLTLEQLQQRLPYVPELHQVLDMARHFNKKAGDDLGGILIVELKAFSPHCDPGDEFEQALVFAAVREVRKAKMADQVIFDSFSPALLYLAAQVAPEIPRELDINGLQLLTAEQIAAITGLPVTIIDKKISLGLAWAEIGPVYRLPGYASVQQFLGAGIATRVRIVGGEMNFFGPAEQQQPGSGAAVVAAAHSLGFKVFADPAGTEAEWNFFASIGVDAVYSNIPMGVRLQPVIPHLDTSFARPKGTTASKRELASPLWGWRELSAIVVSEDALWFAGISGHEVYRVNLRVGTAADGYPPLRAIFEGNQLWMAHGS